MAKNTSTKPTKEIHKTRKGKQQQQQQQQQQLPSWAVMRNILTCKHLEVEPQPQQQQQQQQQPSPQNKKHKQKTTTTTTTTTPPKSKKMRCSGSLCNNTKVMHRPEHQQHQQQQQSASPETRKVKNTPTSTPSSSSHEGSNRSFNTTPISSSLTTEIKGTNHNNNSNNNNNYSVKGMPFRRLTGCYECRMIVDPVLSFTRDPSLRSTICSCTHCGEVFMKPDNLELHLAVRHAVSELGPDDTSKNIVEIIFQSSWLMKQIPVCKIDRILKVHNTQRTINKFEEYRDLIKFKATNLPKKHPRCIADGNELLRFYCTTFKCSLGLNGSSNLCNSIPHCNICSIIKNGFKSLGGPTHEKGILTTASSGRAHERAKVGPDGVERRAMLVCRVIAGRVRKTPAEVPSEECDSVAGATTEVYSNLDELYVFNPRAILPCFVVIYGGF